MRIASLARAVALTVASFAFLAVGAAPAPSQTSPPPTGAAVTTKIAVIDIDRVAAQSESGKQLFQRLKEENDKLTAEKNKREQEVRDMQAKMTSEILSADARERLQREIQRKTTDIQRWLEDAQRDFQEKQQAGEEEFQKKLAPVVEAVAKENNIGLILRATPGLTFVLDPNLDITGLVVTKLNAQAAAAAKPGEPPKPEN
jgi:Skp family chaperone for outer membrane proteins